MSISRSVVAHPIGLSTTAIYALIALVWVGSSRYLARWILLQSNAATESVAVYGAGEAGVRLARALNVGKGLSVVAFIDDKLVLRGSMIDGVSIYSPFELPETRPLKRHLARAAGGAHGVAPPPGRDHPPDGGARRAGPDDPKPRGDRERSRAGRRAA